MTDANQRVETLIRLDDGGAMDIVSSTLPSSLAPMAEALVARVMREQSPAPGVYRLSLTLAGLSVTDPSNRKVDLTKVAGPRDAVAVITIRRDSDHGTTVTKVEVSEGGADKRLINTRLEQALSEAAALVGAKTPVGQSQRIEVVLVQEKSGQEKTGQEKPALQ